MLKRPLNGLRFLAVALALSLGAWAQPVTAQSTNGAPANAEADRAWAELQRAFQPPPVPPEWNGKEPTREQIEQFRSRQAILAGEAADKAQAFQTRFPNDPRADEAWRTEWQFAQIAVRLGNTNKLAHLEKLELARLKDPNTTADERFDIRSRAIQREALNHEAEGRPAVFAALEKGARQLQKEFPGRKETLDLLLLVAQNSPPNKALELAREIHAAAADEQLKAAANGLARRLELVGKPLDLKFTALDGSAFDLAKLKGKVVLVDFWATWCAPCLRELPNVKAVYDKFHSKGFEIVGISFDKDKGALTKLIAREKMTWPQYFDGKHWENDLGRRFGIQSIPTLWLVDKKGTLRDLDGGEDMEGKVGKLLAE
jgi:thiol-disulfide isomerase/thioredoxin